MNALKAEIAKLKNIIKKHEDSKELKTKLEKLEKQSEIILNEKICQKELEFKKFINEKNEEWLKKETELLKQITEYKESIKDLKISNDIIQAKINTQNDKIDENIMGQLDELKITRSNLEETIYKVHKLENINDTLKLEIEQLKKGKNITLKKKIIELEEQLLFLEKDNNGLLLKIKELTENYEKKEKDHLDISKEANKKLLEAQNEIKNLETKLKEYADYKEIKKELEILKSIEFKDEKDEISDINLSPAINESNADSIQVNNLSLEKLLISKNKKIGDELTLLKVVYKEQEEKINTLKMENETINKSFQEQVLLNQKLEENISQLHNFYKESSYASSIADTLLYPLKETSLKSPRSISYKNPIILSKEENADSLKEQLSINNSLLPIIAQQRDRFKTRNLELEKEIKEQFKTITSLRANIQLLQKDNLKLYEETKYLSQYNKKQKNTEIDLENPQSKSHFIYTNFKKMLFNRYNDIYENTLSPFEKFKTKEYYRSTHRLNLLERFFYAISKTICSNKITRNIFMIYFVFIHILTIFNLYNCN
ncbi:unnamed protein product [Pneumocystis jirovecii]|uniref:CASP C-terminal domain-containing protein n=1 Tax=Pneumocystis jirovecii TaxID=42068 RepID=L0PH81_PNEJI|nr:unnamed protein product [Pneumocystis jirovecii]